MKVVQFHIVSASKNAFVVRKCYVNVAQFRFDGLNRRATFSSSLVSLVLNRRATFRVPWSVW